MTATRPAGPSSPSNANPSHSDRAKRIIPYAIILIVGVYLLHLTRGFDYDQMAGSLGPDAWPRLVLLLMIGACAFEGVRLALFWKGDRPSPAMTEDAAARDLDEADVGHDNLRQAACALAAITCYLLALPYVGFFVATLLFIFIFAFIAGYRRPLVMSVVALSLTLGFMFMFMRVIYVSLPIGAEPFSQVSIWIMKVLGVS